MAPALHLALAFLLFPTLILSEPLHVSLTHRRQTRSIGNWADEANKLRKRYGYATAPSHRRRSSRRAAADIPILDQVDIVIVLCFTSTHHKYREEIRVTLLI